MDNCLITALKNDPFILDQYRNIATKFLLTCDSPEKNCLLVTSSVLEEGKSLNALNLSMALAQGINKDVILMDGDLHRPALHNLVDVKTNYGLVNYFWNNADFFNNGDMLVEEIIQPSGIEHLSIIPAGKAHPNPPEILNSRKMQALMAKLKQRQKDGYLIIDSPPIIPTFDPIILSQYADGIILVVNAGKTPRGVIRKAVDMLEKEKILGVLLNNLDVIPYEQSYSYQKYY